MPLRRSSLLTRRKARSEYLLVVHNAREGVRLIDTASGDELAEKIRRAAAKGQTVTVLAVSDSISKIVPLPRPTPIPLPLPGPIHPGGEEQFSKLAARFAMSVGELYAQLKRYDERMTPQDEAAFDKIHRDFDPAKPFGG